MTAVKTKIADYLTAHRYLRLGTVTGNSTPQVHTVYVSEDCTVFFITDKKSRKAENIFANPAVAYAADENYDDIMFILGVQMEGTASLVTLETEVLKIFDRMTQKFTGLEQMPPNQDLVIFKIEPDRAYFLDNNVAFGRRHCVKF
jgi:general stress protein 26